MKRILKRIILTSLILFVLVFIVVPGCFISVQLYKERTRYKKTYSAYDYNSRIYLEQTDSLTDTEHFIYRKMTDLAKSISSGEQDKAILHLNISEMLGKQAFTSKELGVRSVNEKNAGKLSSKLIHYDLDDLILQIGYEYPFEFFWFNKAVDLKTEFEAPYAEDNTLYMPEEITMYLTVCEDYRGADRYTVDLNAIKKAQEAQNYALEIVDQAKNMADYDKLLYYRNRICAETDYFRDTEGRYNSHESYGSPSQMLWVFDQDPDTNVRCEGYTKAFQFLCDHTEFDGSVWCFTVRGVKDEHNTNHCWNIIHMDDGKFYFTDITASDVSSTENHMVGFLQGVDDGSISRGFMMDGVKYRYLRSTIDLWLPRMLEIADSDYPVPHNNS